MKAVQVVVDSGFEEAEGKVQILVGCDFSLSGDSHSNSFCDLQESSSHQALNAEAVEYGKPRWTSVA